MRRMDYCRYDSPTYTGTFNTEQSGFVMNTTPEPGFYFVVVNDPEALQQYSCTFTIKMDIYTHSGWYSPVTEQVYLDYSPEYGNVIPVSDSNRISESSTIELYKLN